MARWVRWKGKSYTLRSWMDEFTGIDPVRFEIYSKDWLNTYFNVGKGKKRRYS